MNVFNVHVNRSPLAGVVERTVYTPGKFFNASFDKASEHNERLSLVLTADAGIRLVCVQIAGLIARRIVCRVKAGDRLDAAQRFGLIRFGSRVDVFLPAGVTPLLKVGDRSVAGETVLGWLPRPADQKVGA
ncbi:MAG: phosphatidylserine decarboxylase, partial [Phycisphaerales bacterium]|nr:phosphatidylserine decarboxylase [Phycisphaerales bacterium]